MPEAAAGPLPEAPVTATAPPPEREARELVAAALDELQADYAHRGIRLSEVAGGWQFHSSPDSALWVGKQMSAKPVRLSRAALETLAIVAYRQPITRPEVEQIRGVDSGNVVKFLLERKLVRILGKKEEAGRPILYGTSRDFLEFFHLKDLRDLPTLREFHELSDEHRAKVEAEAGPEPPPPSPAETVVTADAAETAVAADAVPETGAVPPVELEQPIEVEPAAMENGVSRGGEPQPDDVVEPTPEDLASAASELLGGPAPEQGSSAPGPDSEPEPADDTPGDGEEKT
jgi:segregation and condensation protein B